jgi:hypothetical protein
MLSGGGMNFSLQVAKTMHWNLAHAARAQRLTQSTASAAADQERKQVLDGSQSPRRHGGL